MHVRQGQMAGSASCPPEYPSQWTGTKDGYGRDPSLRRVSSLAVWWDPGRGAGRDSIVSTAPIDARSKYPAIHQTQAPIAAPAENSSEWKDTHHA